MQIFLNGLISGLPIALLAIAFSIVYVPTGVFYLGLGAVYATSPFIAWLLLQLGWSVSFVLITALIVGIVISLLIEWMNHWPLERKKSGFGTHMIASLGVYILIVQLLALFGGQQTKVLRTGLDTVFRFEGIIVTGAQFVQLLVSIILILGFYIWLKFSNLGLQLRGLSENPTEFALRGSSMRKLRFLAFGISGFLASASALVVSYEVGFDPNIGLQALLSAIVAMIIGGRHSFLGPALGGVLLGILQSQAVWFFSAKWQMAVTFILLVLFLFLRPHGIFGARLRLEAQS